MIGKPAIRSEILSRLQADLALQSSAAQLARDEATSEESRAENKYDTRGQEAAYLAEGQARLAAEIQGSLAFYHSFAIPDFVPGDPIAPGALIELTGSGGSAFYFLGPRAGGMEFSVAGQAILRSSPRNPRSVAPSLAAVPGTRSRWVKAPPHKE